MHSASIISSALLLYIFASNVSLIGSKKRSDMEIGAEKLEKALQNHEIVTGKVMKRVKGGYIVEVYHQQG